MSTAAVIERPRARLLLDLVALTKPRVTSLVMATAAVGMGLAPGQIPLGRAAIMLAMTALLVAAANAFNCWLERDTDAFMQRTAGRPLPAGRLDAGTALVFASVLAVASVPLLGLGVNRITGLLGALALSSYVWVYTPLKFRSPWAMVVGAVPGALPPLMGWTAVTGELGAGGVALFAIVFVWQMPHVIGLSVYRRADYAAAGIRVLPLARGLRASQWHAIAWALLLVPVSVSPYLFGFGGYAYLSAALVLSGLYVLAAVRGLTVMGAAQSESAAEPVADGWGRRLFLWSLLYLPLLFLVLLLDPS
jgi:protoheme IX farnesyltransferase